jgi:hypothetical protein
MLDIKKTIVEYFNAIFRSVSDTNSDDHIYVHGSENQYNMRFKKISISDILTKVYNYVLGKIQTDTVIEDAVDSHLSDPLVTTVQDIVDTHLLDASTTTVQSVEVPSTFLSTENIEYVNNVTLSNVLKYSANSLKEHISFISHSDYELATHGAYVDSCFMKSANTDEFLDNLELPTAPAIPYALVLYEGAIVTLDLNNSDGKVGLFCSEGLIDLTNIPATVGYEDVVPIKIQYNNVNFDDSIVLFHSTINEELYIAKFGDLVTNNGTYDITTATVIPCLVCNSNIALYKTENKFLFGIVGNTEELLSRIELAEPLSDIKADAVLTDSSLLDDNTYEADVIYEATFLDTDGAINNLPLTSGNTYYIRNTGANAIKIYPTIADALADLNSEVFADDTYTYDFTTLIIYNIIIANGNPVLVLLDADTHTTEIVDMNTTDFTEILNAPFVDNQFVINPDVNRDIVVSIKDGTLRRFYKLIDVTPVAPDYSYKSLEYLSELDNVVSNKFYVVDNTALEVYAFNNANANNKTSQIINNRIIEGVTVVNNILSVFRLGEYANIRFFKGREIGDYISIFVALDHIASLNSYVYEIYDNKIINYFETNFSKVVNLQHYNSVESNNANIFELHLLCRDASNSYFVKTKTLI